MSNHPHPRRALTPDAACREILADPDPRDYAEFLARRGEINSEILWHLYDSHRIMAPAAAWLLAAQPADDLDQTLDIHDPS